MLARILRSRVCLQAEHILQDMQLVGSLAEGEMPSTGMIPVFALDVGHVNASFYCEAKGHWYIIPYQHLVPEVMAGAAIQQLEHCLLRSRATECRETTSLKLAKLCGCTFVNQYVVIKYLGRGACGRVFLCMDMGDNRLYAVKVRACWLSV